MLRTNLATRPFYNIRAVQGTLVLLALVALALTLFNVVEIVRLSSNERALGGRATQAEQEAARLRADAARIRAQINPKELEVVSTAAREANAIIDQRSFSWTELFTQFEATLPPDVRITAVQPRLERDGRFMVSIAVQAHRVEDLDAFVEALEKRSAFKNVLPAEEQTNPDGLIEAIVNGEYVGRPRAETPAAAPNGARGE